MTDSLPVVCPRPLQLMLVADTWVSMNVHDRLMTRLKTTSKRHNRFFTFSRQLLNITGCSWHAIGPLLNPSRSSEHGQNLDFWSKLAWELDKICRPHVSFPLADGRRLPCLHSGRIPPALDLDRSITTIYLMGTFYVINNWGASPVQV